MKINMYTARHTKCPIFSRRPGALIFFHFMYFLILIPKNLLFLSSDAYNLRYLISKFDFLDFDYFVIFFKNHLTY